MKKYIKVIMCTMVSFTSCSENNNFTTDELSIINGCDSIMRVYTTQDPGDMTILRNRSRDLSYEALVSDEFKRMADLMVATVTHPSQDGVGIAAPQVGINRNVIVVQRFDKGITKEDGCTEFPFEVYANIRITWASDSLSVGSEGCLSVPDMSGDVARSTKIEIEYADIRNPEQPLKMIQETIEGFTAVIFQHETDHLNGILYTDRLAQ